MYVLLVGRQRDLDKGEERSIQPPFGLGNLESSHPTLCSGIYIIFFGWFGRIRVYFLSPFCFLKSFYNHSLFDI